MGRNIDMHLRAVLRSPVGRTGLTVAAFMLAGALIGGALGTVNAQRKGAWVLVLFSGERIAPSRLGPTAEAVFATASVQSRFAQHLRERGVSPDSVDAHLKPVPDTRGVVVEGTGPTTLQASAAAESGALALVETFREERFRSFSALPIATPVNPAGGLSLPVAVAAGLGAGFWLGLAMSWLVWLRPSRSDAQRTDGLHVFTQDPQRIPIGLGKSQRQ